MRKFYEKLEQEDIVRKFAHKSTGTDKSNDSFDSSQVQDEFLEQDSEHEEKASPEGSEEELGALGET
jgi:hypothetical protein